MSGTKESAKRSVATVRRIYGSAHYRKMGRLGGLVKTDQLKGFATNRELARTAGRKGGLISKRKPKK